MHTARAATMSTHLQRYPRVNQSLSARMFITPTHANDRLRPTCHRSPYRFRLLSLPPSTITDL